MYRTRRPELGAAYRNRIDDLINTSLTSETHTHVPSSAELLGSALGRTSGSAASWAVQVRHWRARWQTGELRAGRVRVLVPPGPRGLLGLTGRGSAQVHDAEDVAVRIGEDDEVRVRWVQVPVDSDGSQLDQTLDLGTLLVCSVHH